MNASCSIPQDRPLGLLLSKGGLLLRDETAGVQILATVMAGKHMERATTTSPATTEICVIAAFLRS